MSPRRLAASVSVLAASLAMFGLASSSQAYCRTTTVRSQVVGECSMSGIPLLWQSLCAGYSLYVEGSPELTMDQIRPEAQAAAGRWHMAPCDANGSTTPYFQVLPLPDTSMPTGFNRSGFNANTIGFNSVWRLDHSHQLGTIAITLVTFDNTNGEILDADMEMNQASDQNPDGFHFTVGTPDPSAADLPTILTHEFGHFQGLGHSIVDTAVMWPQAGLGEQRRNLRTDDVQGICDAYNPDYTPTDRTCNPTPYGGFASNTFGGQARGSCAVRAPGSGSAGRAWVLMGIAGLIVVRRRRGARKAPYG